MRLPAQARKHAEADVDIIIAQGGEGGGHCGEVGSIVLWPQVVRRSHRPVLAAGGIGSGQQIAAALALGCQGAWSGSQWLMVEEAHNTPVQQAAYVKATSRDTVRSRSFTGKPCRMLKNDWTEAWQTPGNPEPLGMPLQYMVSGMAVAATNKYPPTRPSTWPSIRSARLSASSPRSRRPPRSSSAGCRSTSRPPGGSRRSTRPPRPSV